MSHQICNVLIEPNDSDLTIQLKYGNPTARLFTFRRKREELLSEFSKRMKLNIEKIEKKNKNNLELDVAFHRSEDKLEDLDTLTNQSFWTEGSQVHINQQIYNVHVNLPTITELRIANVILSNLRIFPNINIRNGKVADCVFTWYRRREANEEWAQIGEGFTYKVVPADIGHYIRLVCIPGNGNATGLECEAISPKPITQGPDQCPFAKRDIGQVEPDCFRVVSYNLLADIYAGTDYSATALFPYCQPKFLCFDYRKLLIVEELIHYDAGIYFLQEVDKNFFERALQPIFEIHKRRSKFCCKRDIIEGLAIVYRDDYVCLREESHNIGELLLEHNLFAQLRDKLSCNEKLYKKITTLKNSCQAVLLQTNKNKLLLVANVHLYSQDVADLIRLVQAYVCFVYLQELRESIEGELSESVSIIISGDFNSTPEFAVVKLATQGRVDSTLEDFKTCPQDCLDDLVLESKLTLESACGYPPYTNYTQGFVGCLDYIFYEPSHLSVVHTFPLPEHEQVTRETALPSSHFPSDHLALGCIFKFSRS